MNDALGALPQSRCCLRRLLVAGGPCHLYSTASPTVAADLIDTMPVINCVECQQACMYDRRCASCSCHVCAQVAACGTGCGMCHGGSPPCRLTHCLQTDAYAVQHLRTGTVLAATSVTLHRA